MSEEGKEKKTSFGDTTLGELLGWAVIILIGAIAYLVYKWASLGFPKFWE